jgi:hypothetical protein
MTDPDHFLRLLVNCASSRKCLDQVRQLLMSLNQDVRFDDWTPEMASSYHRLLDEIAALDMYLHALELTYTKEISSRKNLENPSTSEQAHDSGASW